MRQLKVQKLITYLEAKGESSFISKSLWIQHLLYWKSWKGQFWEKILNTLKKSTIDIKQLQIGTEKSGMSVAVVDKKGNYSATIVSGANLNIDCKKIIIKKNTGILLYKTKFLKKSI